MANPDAFEYAGASGGFLDRYGYPFCRGRIFDTVEDDNGQYDNSEEVLWATGACLMIRAKDYWTAGGLDGRFFAHNEEIDSVGACIRWGNASSASLRAMSITSEAVRYPSRIHVRPS